MGLFTETAPRAWLSYPIFNAASAKTAGGRVAGGGYCFCEAGTAARLEDRERQS